MGEKTAFEAGGFTTEVTESTEEAMEKDPFNGKVIGFHVQRLADGIERFKL